MCKNDSIVPFLLRFWCQILDINYRYFSLKFTPISREYVILHADINFMWIGLIYFLQSVYTNCILLVLSVAIKAHNTGVHIDILISCNISFMLPHIQGRFPSIPSTVCAETKVVPPLTFRLTYTYDNFVKVLNLFLIYIL